MNGVIKKLIIISSIALVLVACTKAEEKPKDGSILEHETKILDEIKYHEFKIPQRIYPYDILDINENYLYYRKNTEDYKHSVIRINREGHEEVILSEESLQGLRVLSFTEHNESYYYIIEDDIPYIDQDELNIRVIKMTGDKSEEIYHNSMSQRSMEPTFHSVSNKLYLLENRSEEINDELLDGFAIYDLTEQKLVYKSDAVKLMDHVTPCYDVGVTEVVNDVLYITFNNKTFKFEEDNVEELFDYQVSQVVRLGDQYLHLDIDTSHLGFMEISFLALEPRSLLVLNEAGTEKLMLDGSIMKILESNETSSIIDIDDDIYLFEYNGQAIDYKKVNTLNMMNDYHRVNNGLITYDYDQEVQTIDKLVFINR